MTLTFERVGLPPAVRYRPDATWRTWAHEVADAQDERGWTDVTLTFTPLALDRRSLFTAVTYWDTVGHVIDGLIGARLLDGPGAITAVRLERSELAGVNGLRVTVERAAT